MVCHRQIQAHVPELRKDDCVLVEAGDIIPGDGEIVVGVA
jgi:K+-transporting ATPase ATPase B chain